MHFSTTLLVAFSALAVAQQSSQAVDNPATGYLGQTNADGAVTGQPQPATSQEGPITSQQPAATIAAGESTGFVPTQTGQPSTLPTSPQESNHESIPGSPTSTGFGSSFRPSPTDDLYPSSSHFGSIGAGAIHTPGPVGLGVGLAGAALAAFL